MIDRVVQYPNRYKLALVSGTTDTYDITVAPGTVTQEGDPLCKATLLPDDVTTILCLSQTDPQVSDALTQLASQGKYVYILTVKLPNGQPLIGYVINGLSPVPWGKSVTDSNGVFTGTSSSANPTISINITGYVDLKSYSGTITSTGAITSTEITIQANTPGEVAYTTSTSIKFFNDVLVDVHCVSGGSDGGVCTTTSSMGSSGVAGVGGNGGGQKYGTNIPVAKDTSIPITVGGIGGNSSAFGITPNNSFSGGASRAAGTSLTMQKYGYGGNVVTCSGGGGGICAYDQAQVGGSLGGSPYGGKGGSGFVLAAEIAATNGTDASGYGSGGGGGGAIAGNITPYPSGGKGTPGIVYIKWRFAA